MNEKTINIELFRKTMATKEEICDGSEMFIIFHKLAQEALQITSEINNKYNTPEQIVELFSKLTGTQVDKSFRCFPPFYTDCGKNIKIGKNVFINACCRFQDQGGIEIGDGAVIGAGSVVTKNVHANSIAVGSPARVIKQIEIK